jgi:hypothetical protein
VAAGGGDVVTGAVAAGGGLGGAVVATGVDLVAHAAASRPPASDAITNALMFRTPFTGM